MNTPVTPKKIQGAVIHIHIGFSETAPASGDKKLQQLSDAVDLVVPAITRSGGMLTRITDEGIAAVFERSAEDALHGALEIFYDAEKAPDAGRYAAMSIGIHEATVFLAQFGCGHFTTLVAFSDGIHFTRKLSESAARFDSRILMTRTALERIRSFDTRFNCRKLGLFYHSAGGAEEMVYDMFDSDPTGLKYRKKREKLVFETGVSLFLKGEYLQSRNYFIELLKYDRNDKTAKEYVFMCDKALSGQPMTPYGKYLEAW